MPEISPSKYLVQASWDHVPHLDAATKERLLASTPPHLRDARSKGIPSLGSGAIYPIELSEILITPFSLPDFWPRLFAMDVGWKKTAALWGAWDRSTDVIYAYTEHYRGQAEPSIHATAIKARGDWIPGVIDPASRGRSQDDGGQLIAQYQDLGLPIVPVDKENRGVESGLYEVWERLSTGRLKIFSTLMNTQAEYRLYRRDERGNIVKEFDHLMDTLRYLVVSMRQHAICRPVSTSGAIIGSAGGGDPTTGY